MKKFSFILVVLFGFTACCNCATEKTVEAVDSVAETVDTVEVVDSVAVDSVL